MAFVRINKYIHEYDFKVNTILNPHLPKIEEYFINNYEKTLKTKVANLPLGDFIPNLNNLLVKEVYKIIYKYYNVTKNYYRYNNVSVYYQTQSKYVNQFHNHKHDNNDIVGTFYIHNLSPNDGGNLEFWLPPDPIQSITPQINKLYLFPGWLLHRPSPHTGEGKRFCFNIGFNNKFNPVHKITGDKW